MSAPSSLLLLCDYRTDIAATVSQHIDALVGLSRHNVHRLSVFGELPTELDLNRFDGIVIHYSIAADLDAFLSPAAIARIGAFPGFKAMFIQDEHRHVNKTIDDLIRLGIGLLFTCVPRAHIEKVYPADRLPGVRKLNTLTGYVERDLLSRVVPPLSDRAIDVGYRARRLPAWLGVLGQEKVRIAERFLADSSRFGLCTDISCREESRLYGEAWIRFLTNCKAVLGSESGASVFDFDGSICKAVDADLAANPKLDFQTLSDRHFKHVDGSIPNNQISPRCFEAAALRTAMILYEGEYSGRLKPWRHYVPLRKDHSNMEEVVAILRDPERLQGIVDAAYYEVAQNPANQFAQLVSEFDHAMDSGVGQLGRPRADGYSPSEFGKAARPHWRTHWSKLKRSVFQQLHRFILGVLLAMASEETRDRIQWHLRKGGHALRHAGASLRGRLMDRA